MEDIILNVVLTGVLLAVLFAMFIERKVVNYMPENTAIAIFLLFWLSVSVSIFGTITLIWI